MFDRAWGGSTEFGFFRNGTPSPMMDGSLVHRMTREQFSASAFFEEVCACAEWPTRVRGHAHVRAPMRMRMCTQGLTPVAGLLVQVYVSRRGLVRIVKARAVDEP